MRCLECPMWHPMSEDSGYCLYSNCETHPNHVCRTMKNCTPKVIKGIPNIPEDADIPIKKKMITIMLEKKM